MNNQRQECVPCAPDPRLDQGIPAFGFRIGLSLAFAGQGMVFGLGYSNALKAGEAPAPGSFLYGFLHGGLILSAVAVALLLGRPLLQQTARSLSERRLSVESLFVLSGFGAFGGSLLSTIRGSGSVYYEVVSIVFCVYAIGRQIGVIQKGRVAQAIAAFKHAFDSAVVELDDGTTATRPTSMVGPTDIVIVQPGGPVPVDGTILEGKGYVRETALTGEPVPVVKAVSDPVMAGTWSLDGNFKIRPGDTGARMIDGIIDLLENPTQRMSQLQQTADRLMQFFVPVVCATAIGTFFGWLYLGSSDWWDALFNSMSVLLVACPCALGLAMPAGIWGGLYHLSQRGIAGRNGHLIDSLAGSDRIVFDKTGTLTQFDLEADTSGVGDSIAERDRILACVAAVASNSSHPVSEALARLAVPAGRVRDLIVHPGSGLEATVDGSHWFIGEADLLEQNGISVDSSGTGRGKPVHVAADGKFLGTVLLAERLRPEVESTLGELQNMGLKCQVLSGDPNPVLSSIAGLDIRHGLSPGEKAACMRCWTAEGSRVLFIGDGINDLPAMQAADASLAIDLGAALATEFADGLLVNGRIACLPSCVRFCRKLKRSLSGNMKFALAYNLAGMVLAAAGMLHPVVAALLMVGSSVIVSLRALRIIES